MKDWRESLAAKRLEVCGSLYQLSRSSHGFLSALIRVYIDKYRSEKDG